MALEVEPVVGVAAVERAAVRGHKAARPEETQVVGDKVRRPADHLGQLAHTPVRGGELGEQPPTERVPSELEQDGRTCLHVADITSN